MTGNDISTNQLSPFIREAFAPFSFVLFLNFRPKKGFYIFFSHIPFLPQMKIRKNKQNKRNNNNKTE